MQLFKVLARTEFTAVNPVHFCFFVFPFLSKIRVHEGNWILYRKQKGNISFACLIILGTLSTLLPTYTKLVLNLKLALP